jgi:squalene synthase HpnC
MRIYGFARLVDDIGDEIGGDRLVALDAVDRDLDAIFRPLDRRAEPRHPLMTALATSVRELSLPEQPFRDLVTANRRDQLVHRYATFAELVEYCQLSADPVGRLVLAVFGVATPERIRLSDSVCTGLQLVEHWQDVVEDFARDRIYLPKEDLDRFGVAEADLGGRQATPAFRQLMAFECERAGQWLTRGAGLVGLLHGRPRIATAGFIAGGRAALAAIAGVDHDVVTHRTRPRRARLFAEWVRLLAVRR